MITDGDDNIVGSIAGEMTPTGLYPRLFHTNCVFHLVITNITTDTGRLTGVGRDVRADAVRRLLSLARWARSPTAAEALYASLVADVRAKVQRASASEQTNHWSCRRISSRFRRRT